MSETSNNAVTKKKTKKRRKGKNAGKVLGVSSEIPGECSTTELPKQVSEKEEQVIMTAKCQRCKGTFRQMIIQNGVSNMLMPAANWVCPSCVQEMRSLEDKHAGNKPARSLRNMNDSLGNSNLGGSGCNCPACVAKRDNAVSPEAENDAQITQRYWMEIRQMVRAIYRESMSLSNQEDKAMIGSLEMVKIVKILSGRDPHLFFQRLETLAREYLLEVKVRLLEQLSCGFNSPQLAIEFIQMLLEEYGFLCNALPTLLFLLKPVEDCDYIQRLGMTIELMNKNIFRELIFAESFMSSNLPLIIAQLRLASLSSDIFHRNAADELSQRYVALDHEMNEICRIWRSAIDHMNHQHLEERKTHFEKIKADGDSFKQQVKMTISEENSKQAIEGKTHNGCSRVTATPNDVPNMPSCAERSQSGGVGGVSHVQALFQSHMDDNMGFNSKEAAEWAKLLFKCMNPIGAPEFQVKGDTATQTILVHMDMNKLDLSHAKPCFKQESLLKYQQIGLTMEEIVEVTLKLSALEKLGIYMKIEDLFDEEGYSLSKINTTVVDKVTLPKAQHLYFVDSDEEEEQCSVDDGDKECCGCVFHSPQEEVNFQYIKEKILLRQSCNGKPVSSVSSSFMDGDKNRLQDFLQGMVMMMRFTKRLTLEDLNKNVYSEGKVMFSSCDQIQIKLIQLELNSVRITANNLIGDNLGLDSQMSQSSSSSMGSVSSRDKSPSDYALVHTDSHHEFMDMLLEKRKELEDVITSKEKSRRLSKKSQSDPVKKSKPKTGSRTEKGQSSGLALPRYQVQEQQECSHFDSSSKPVIGKCSSKNSDSQSKSMTPDGKKGSFKPLYRSNGMKPCHCSACIGAVATIISPECYRHRLKSSDPSTETITIECSVSSHVGANGEVWPSMHSMEKEIVLKGKSSVNIALDMTCSSEFESLSPLSKEGLWQNWMSTSGSAQLESESLVPNGNHHHGNHHHCGHVDGYVPDGEKSIVCEFHETDCISSGSPMTTCHQQTRSCNGHHFTSSCSAKENNDACKNGGQGYGNGGSGEVPRRYCPCCYCELFGHNGPPTAPTSQNYTKRRDILRHKLEEKKKQKDHTSKSGCVVQNGSKKEQLASVEDKKEQLTSVEDLLAFIEGECEDAEQSTISKSSKRQRKKQQKKHQDSDFLSIGNNIPPSNQCLFHHINQGSLVGCVAPDTSLCTCDVSSEQDDGSHQQDNMTVESHDVNGDEYDDELEEFKKFCFDDAPVGPRKKIAISLNMNDIMSKIK